MQNKKLWCWAIGILAGVVVVISYFFFLAPSADSLVPLPFSDNKEYTTLNQQVVKDIPNEGDLAYLQRKIDDYYDFAFSSTDGPGGIEMIAHMKSDDHFEKIWSGQDIPPCEFIKFAVPAGIVPYCYGGRNNSIVVDRSNFVRTWYTLLFNPYVNDKGQVVYPQ